MIQTFTALVITLIIVVFITLTMLAISGCGPSQEAPLIEADGVEVQRAEQLPPSFGLGDKVSPNGSDRIGIVVEQRQNQTEWQYNVMFDNWRFNYSEEEITLIERMDWDKRVEPEVKAEVEDDVPFDILEETEE